ncbi:MAG TPA: alpha/beta hydrolase [Burkholderiales bacterium]|jgi:acetyl esterase/lipase|nr:alpha/beta hydrolase [Burkholderiales bacterium]
MAATPVHEIEVSEVPFRRNAAGRQLMARVYQPKGKGPFPALLDLHGGAWYRKDRTANEPMDRAVAAGGVLVVAIDMTLAGEAPYPASVDDARHGVRWLKEKARQWNGDATRLGLLGSSSGGHIAQLVALQPGPGEGVAYVATRSPISDPYARFQQAEKTKREHLIEASRIYFRPWETIFAANPQKLLERREATALPPLLIMQGGLDENVLPALQEKFAAAYRAAGGKCELAVFDGCEHEWVAQPGPQTERAHQMVKAFIARYL